MGSRRVMQITIAALFGLLGLGTLATAATHHGSMIPAGFMFFIAGMSVVMFEWQIRSMRRQGTNVRATLDAIAKTFFDEPREVRAGYDLSVTAGDTAASFAGAMESDVGFTVDGRCKGVSVSVASHSSTLGRQLGEMSHVYSHVCVDLQGLQTTFKLTKQGVGSAIGNLAGVSKDSPIGDAAFDAAWNIDADAALARAVLDEPVKERLASLRSRVQLVSQDVGVGTMSVVATRHGLAIRWPGELTPELAAYMRDLLLDMRRNMLAYVGKTAAQAGATAAGAAGGYRVATDAAAPPGSGVAGDTEAEELAEAEKRARA